ncbi:MAG TPA: gephyrin-like molybdotransferase Glp [Thermoleophilaceae bacterium]|nr:gephyrin-like molybdotransferase Glp [Thermoleophilaceae bacterium]
MSELISIDEARRRVLEAVRPLPAEDVPLDEALDRVLGEDVESPIDVPPFDSSAMDGYAVVAGPEAELEIVGESRAGHPAGEHVRPGTAIRISTGAALPEGATAVVPVERAAAGGREREALRAPSGGASSDGRVHVSASAPGDNIRRAGEDVRAGRVVLAAGTTLGPAELGVAASVGRAELRCALRPRVAVLVTGDELTEPGRPLSPGGIYSSNGWALAAQVERAAALVTARRTVPDTAAETRAALSQALDDSDLVIVSGGVSVGPHDHVKPALAQLHVEERFWGVRLRPGKPTWFGVRGNALVFGLPGNPVSAMVAFHLFVRPALAGLQGADPSARTAPATLDEPIPRHPTREQAVRVRLERAPGGWRARPTGPQGSHMLTSMLGASALARVAPGEGELPAGEQLEVELL